MKTNDNPSERRLLYLVREVATAIDFARAEDMREKLLIALTNVQADALQGDQ